MSINIRLRLVAVAALVSFASACASGAGRQSTGEYFDDAVITTKVKAALLADETVEGLDVSVETWQGVVQLGGFVDSREDIRRAEELAESVAGVVDVQNDLRLKSDR